jgi:hypothetical protein
LYLIRWQLSTPILAVCVWYFLDKLGAMQSTIIANFIGGLIFFWIDRWIFRNTSILTGELWETQLNIVCSDCGQPTDKGYRLVKAAGYDKMGDKKPQFRCHPCSRAKYAHDWEEQNQTTP